MSQTSVTRSGVRVWTDGPAVHSPTRALALPDGAGVPLDIVAADIIDGDVWVVCTGGADDRGYLLRLGAGSVRAYDVVHGRYASWVTDDGDVSWVPASNPYIVKHLDGREGPSRDTKHPLSQDQATLRDLGHGARGVQQFRSAPWTIWEDVASTDTVTRIFAQKDGEPLQVAYEGAYCPLPAHCAAHPDGSCTVAIQMPRGIDGAVWVHSSRFTLYTPPSTPPPQEPLPAPTPEPVMPPDHSHIVRAIDAQFPHLLRTNTRETCREFLWRAAWALAQVDPRWGMLSKSAGENHVVINEQMVAIDAVTYLDWDGVVDIIANNSAAPEPGRPSWGIDGKRPSNVWVQAVPFRADGDPVPTPTPPPPPQECGIADAELVKAFEAFTAAAQLLPELVRQTVREELKAGLEEMLERLPAPPAPTVTHPPYRLRVLGQTVTAYPVPPQ